MKIDVTEEQYYNFMKGENIEIVPPKKEYVIEYEIDKSYMVHVNNYDICCDVYNRAMEHGRYRKTKENAEYSLKRNQRDNRLEALVEDLQGELGVGDSYIYYIKSEDRYCPCRKHDNHTFPELVMMTQITAKKVCELLNSKPAQYSLEG